MRILVLFLIVFLDAGVLASTSNDRLNVGVGMAKSAVISTGVSELDWESFLTYIRTNPVLPTETEPDLTRLARERKGVDSFKSDIISLFHAWKSAKAIAEATHVDEDFREDHGLYDASATTSPARSGTGGGGAGRGSVVSGTHRSTAFSRGFSVGASTMGVATDQVTGLLDQLRKLKEAADLRNPISAANRASEMNKVTADVREANLQAFFNEDDLRASYIKVLLEDAKHRGEVLAAINNLANADFRTALIGALLRNDTARGQILDALHTTHSGEMIAKLHGDGTRPAVINHLSTNHPNDMVAKVVSDHRPPVIAALIPEHLAEVINALIPTRIAAFTALLGTNDAFRGAMLEGLVTGHQAAVLTRLGMGTLPERINNLVTDGPNRATIAQAFVDSLDFRNVLIARLEAGHHAINATRMLWHDIDALDHAAFWASVAANTPNLIVTNVAFEHLLAKTRDGYENLGHGLVADPRGRFRERFADGNLVGKDGTHIGSTKRR